MALKSGSSAIPRPPSTASRSTSLLLARKGPSTATTTRSAAPPRPRLLHAHIRDHRLPQHQHILVILELLAACLNDGCRSQVLDLAFAVDSFSKNQALILEGSESVVALSRKYMLQTTDMNCDPGKQTCPPSFNQRYPLPEDLAHPIYYQTFSTSILDITHPCYQKDQFFWRIILDREGENDGNISATARELVPGMLHTAMPSSFAASRSTLLVPVAVRPTNTVSMKGSSGKKADHSDAETAAPAGEEAVMRGRGFGPSIRPRLGCTPPQC
mgnify:CR=1 FL=1